MKTPMILFVIALTIRLAAIFFWKFDGLYGQDPFAYFQQGLAIADNLPQEYLPPTIFFGPTVIPYSLLFSLFLPDKPL